MQTRTILTEFSSLDSWSILSDIERSIKAKIEAVGTPLIDWKISINYGIKTGFNDAFIIDASRRQDILKACQSEDERQRTAEIIRPILRGRDIKRYAYEWENLWLVYIPWHFPYQFDENIQGASDKAEKDFKEKYPAVYSHLLKYKEPLSKRNKAETGIRYEWYAMQRWGAQYWDEFSKPKIIWKRVGSIVRFAYDDKGLFGLDSTCFATGKHMSYLCCLLNSSMGHYLLNSAPRTGTGDLLISVQAVEPIKVPLIDDYDIRFDEFVKQAVASPTNTLIEEIDNIIFDLYGLSEGEREYIIKNYR